MRLLQANKQFVSILQNNSENKLAFNLHKKLTSKYYEYQIILRINKFKSSEEKLCINLVYIKLIKQFKLLKNLLLH